MCGRLNLWPGQHYSAWLLGAAWFAGSLSLASGCGDEKKETGSVSAPVGGDDSDDDDTDDDSAPSGSANMGRADSGPSAGGDRGNAADGGPRRDASGADSGAGSRRDSGANAADGGAADSASGSAADASVGDSGGGVVTAQTFKRGCKDLDPGPCASFVPGGPYGAKELELGPYGASLDYNTGKDFAYPVASGDADNDFTCGLISGGQTSMMPKGPQAVDYSAYSVYRPGQYKEGEKLPIIVWGNGTCAWPEAYGPLLRYVASHGFFIVAPNSRWVGDAVAMKKGLDFAFAANDDSNSPYYQKLDTTRVGAMGHSQGSSGTANLASDSRVKAVILWNGGSSASKPFLAVTGDGDIGNPSPASMRSALNSARVKGAFLFYHMILQMSDSPGHLTLVTEPGRVVEPAVAWWKYILNGDAASKDYFVGADCKLCNRMAEFEFGQKGLD